MTNFEYITQSQEKLVEAMIGDVYATTCNICAAKDDCDDDCTWGILEWLKAERKENRP